MPATITVFKVQAKDLEKQVLDAEDGIKEFGEFVDEKNATIEELQGELTSVKSAMEDQVR